MAELTGKTGFAAPIAERPLSRRSTAGVALFASAALAICLVVAVTAVSIGVARTRAVGAAVGSHSAPIAVVIGAVMNGVSGLSALAAHGPSPAIVGLGSVSD